MPTSSILTLLLTLLPLASDSTAVSATECSVYELSAELVVSILPEPLRSFYFGKLARLKAGVCKHSRESGEHLRVVLPLDAPAASIDRPSRLDAVRKYSNPVAASDETEYLTVRIQRQVDFLRETLPKDGTGDATVDSTAVLIHWATDAALPFNTTCGALSGAADADSFVRDRQSRYHGVLVERLKTRLEREARIDAARLKPATRVADAVLDSAREAYQWIDPLLDIEATVAAEILAKPGEASEKHEERFLEELADRAYPIIEARIEAGALLAANLIVGAWNEKGKSEVRLGTSAETSVQPIEVAPEPSTPAVAMLGSKDSSVFHRADCVHLARVKPENRVSFEDAKSAIAKGRKPCKSCKPDAASPANVTP